MKNILPTIPKLKIAIVSAFPPSRGTLNEYALHLSQALLMDPRVDSVVIFADKLGHDNVERELNLPKLKVVRCWEFNDPLNAVRLLRQAKREQPDAVIFNSHFRSFAESSVASALGLISAPLLRIAGFRSILILHNIMEAVDLVSTGMVKNPIVAKGLTAVGTILTHVLLASNRVSVLLPSYEKILNEKYDAKNVVHIPHGVFGETPEFLPPIPSGRRRLVTFGKFGTYKKVEGLIEAAELLRTRGISDLEVVIAGTDSPNTPGYLKSVRKQYSHVSNLVFTGYLAEEDVEPTLASATVVVLPYTSTTGSSGVLHQVGRVGRAAVLPDIGDLAVLIRSEGYAGETFIPGSTDSLASALERVLNDSEHRENLQQTNFLASQKCSIQSVAARYVDEIVAIAEGSVSSAHGDALHAEP